MTGDANSLPPESTREKRWSRLRWSLWLGFLLAWTVALVLPGYVFPPTVTGLKPAGIPFGKILHVACYALLAAAVPGLPIARRTRWLLLAGLSLHTFATEFAQAFVPSRGPSLFDVGLDHCGLAAGVLLTWFWPGGGRQAPNNR